MLFAVIKREGDRDVGINHDGTTEDNPDNFELMDRKAATLLAGMHGGRAVPEIQLSSHDFEGEWDFEGERPAQDGP